MALASWVEDHYAAAVAAQHEAVFGGSNVVSIRLEYGDVAVALMQAR